MQTIKTAVVVVLLLAVCYGAIVALNAPDPKLPPELQHWADGGSDLDLTMDAKDLVALDPPRLPKSSDLRSQADPLRTTAPKELDAHDSNPTLAPPTLPQTDLSGQPIGGKWPAELTSLPIVRTNVTQGPDGPTVQLPRTTGQPGLDSSGASLPSQRSSNTGTSYPGMETRIPIPGMLIASASSNSDSGSRAPEAAHDFSSANSIVAASQPSIAAVGPSAVVTSATPSGLGDSTPNATTNANSAKLPTQPFKLAREQALKQAAMGKLKDALAALSLYYHSVELTRDEFIDLVDLLDALSREVIYSKQHLMEPAYRVEAGDTLPSIALKHNVSIELLARINGRAESNVVLPGTELKVLRGPCRAEVDLTRGELTIFVGDLYAGRFPISTGQDPVPREGNYEIVDKRRDRTYYGTGGNVISAEDPRNPYGGFWMNLGQDMCIHGTPEMATTDLSKAGCISLAPIDASDIYGILAQGSRIRVHR